jgi:Glycosyl hydrolase family 26
MPHAQNRSNPLGDSPDATRPPKNGGKAVRVRWLLPLTFSIIIGFVASCFPANAASSVIFGGVGGVASLSKASGMAVPENRYAHLNASPPNTRMINLMPNSNWAAVAAATPGSTTYNDLLRWGNTLKSRGTPVWLAFSHEPEAHASRSLGNSAQFIAAFRKVVTVIRSTGEHNVQFVWQMTSYAFQVNSSDARYAPKWYPGSAYVDLVGADPYNWYNCGSGRGTWTQLSTLTQPVLNWAKSQGKGLVLGEYGSQQGPLRAQWLRNAGTWARANSGTLKGMFYFNVGPQGPSLGCHWVLSSSTDLSAFANGVMR